MHKYLTEFIGTFFLVLTIGLAIAKAGAMAPLAIGASLMVMVYMGGHVSGAHYNPAVSLAALIRGALSVQDFIIYVVFQVAGALTASIASYGILGHTFAPAPAKNTTEGLVAALAVEILYTFALALVVLNVATAKKAAGNSYFGLAIGFTVAAGAFAGGSISGGAFNPAVGTGPTVIDVVLGQGSLSYLWLYLVGPFTGGALAAGVFLMQEKGASGAA
ncbi:MAG: aquaporin [Planctomycetes bacterium]|nr:aquaporin [Planctomycetota bacterium]